MSRVNQKPKAAQLRDKPSRSPSLTSVGFLMHRAQMRLGEGTVAAIEGSGLHLGHLGVLGALTDAGPMNQRGLSELTLIDKSSMVIFLDGLERGGWVRRVRDPEDRRAHIVEITDDGAARFAALGVKLKAVQDRFLAPLDGQERETLVDLLIRLATDHVSVRSR
jgi:DNA-binding MarR family transcriptional regulator